MNLKFWKIGEKTPEIIKEIHFLKEFIIRFPVYDLYIFLYLKALKTKLANLKKIGIPYIHINFT